MSGVDKKPDAARTDGSIGEGKIKPLKRPVSSDGFLIDRPLSPEEEGLAGPLPEDNGSGQRKSRK